MGGASGRPLGGLALAMAGVLTVCGSCSSNGGAQSKGVAPTTKPPVVTSTSTTSTTIAPQLPAQVLAHGRGLLDVSDLGVGWATNPQGGMKSWVEDFTGGNCGGPDLAARSRGNSGVDVVDFEQNATTGPFLEETVVAYPTVEQARFAFRDTAVSSYECGSWTDKTGYVVAISDLPSISIGTQSVAKRTTWTVTSQYCNEGWVSSYIDLLEVQLRAQFIRFQLSTSGIPGTCDAQGPPASPPNDAVLYALARRGLRKYERALAIYTSAVYARRERSAG